MPLPDWKELPANVKGSPKLLYNLVKEEIDKLETPKISKKTTKGDK